MFDIIPKQMVWDLIIIGTIWLFLLTPFKSEVRRKVGEDLYRKILGEYKKMHRDRAFGITALALSIIYQLCADTDNMPAMSCTARTIFRTFPYSFVIGGMYCYLMGFMKAMACVIKSAEAKENQ